MTNWGASVKGLSQKACATELSDKPQYPWNHKAEA